MLACAFRMGRVDEMIGLQQAAGQLDMMEVGAVAADSHIDQVLVGLNIVELHALLAGHIGYARDLIAFHGIAADGGSLGNNNALGIGFLDFADDCADDLGIGADRSIGGEAWPALGLSITVVPGLIMFVTPPIRSKTLVTLS